MPALVAGIHVFARSKQDVDGRDKPAMTKSHIKINDSMMKARRAA
jgi:hypothetical protein